MVPKGTCQGFALGLNTLEVLWNAHDVDRRIKQALLEMFENRERGFIGLIRRKEPKLRPKEIVDSLRQLDVRIESVTVVPGSARQGKSRRPSEPRAKVQPKQGIANRSLTV